MDHDEESSQSMAKSLDIQRLESSLNMEPFLTYAQDILSQPLSSSEDSDSDIDSDMYATDFRYINGNMAMKCGNYKFEMKMSSIEMTGTCNVQSKPLP